MTRPRVGVAVLTMGDRMPGLLALLTSVARQDEAAARVVVVGNGTALPGLPEWVTVVELGPVTTFLGGGHALSMPMLEETGPWPDAFFFTHEETDLAWRAIDRGWDVLYEPQLVLQHPKTSPARHAVYYRMTARNRVWLAKRHLPAPLVPVYLGVWVALTVARTRSVAGLRAWLGGFAEGIRTSGGPRRPMRWRTVWRLTRLGRPPVI
ncbi:glycosyltransferase family 2 protein [Streptomyces goshikiensis]|uniref:glycosyltransferase family 2 protein n=1 Tax=Streptomyces goshikiensis TaxID=1942 RepID=UPI0036BE5E09